MGIPTLLLNAFIIILCIFCYQIFWLDKAGKEARNNVLISFLSSIAIVLCMTFPFSFHSGYIYDLRLIPILLAALYGGFRSFIFITFIYLSYRFYLGGNGFFPSVIVHFMLTFIIMASHYFLSGYLKKRKILFGTLLIFLCTTCFSVFAIMNEIRISAKVEFVCIHFLANFIVINTLTVLLSLYLIEGMIEKFKMKEKIYRAEKFNVTSELAASIAHEIRNPLTTLYGFIQLFNKNEISETQKSEYLQVMLIELEKIQLVINDYLSLVKPQMVVKETLDIRSIVYQVIDVILPMASLHNVKVESDMIGSLYINANAVNIKRCLINIAKNGIEAMTNGGVLRINVKKIKNNIVIEIIDSGIGMSPEEINRIALPFYSTKGKGTGLGTMISYGIIKELNGDIEIKSEIGKGTRFSIIIPSS
ncbi:ATP-binding protein [Aneurinibacillus migulanus]|uniref:histidine kinase n=1 Tax=Aneurinibacillus migulanus TaxID=47500 RepID=A0A0D1YE19_ANEMI|nr:ATP-binding protein [Aneurinibacillus migulanus]KIV57207.1 sporulation kinase [Aneurinibacillus migulanus]KON96900.1 sporulation kinase [Aneurinibacillus migulanus]MED0894261.1 ATP-binding protein [Aneurinibacillus migulanus]MED1619534.1 ATP-binding protein [Aneurinibacillus migulanus]SDJ69383.1 two-component system, sporulation sensor kinase B [Aneurinibacillus migulanus]